MLTLSLYVLAFLSGFAALVYQVAWARMLSLTFGSSTLAVSAVVASFMGGMGIGAWLYHRVGERIRPALRLYGFLELGIAVSTAVFTLLFGYLPGWFAAVAGVLTPGLALDGFRILSVFLLIALPAALMGATYPALCDALIHSRQELEQRLGWIYGLNTLGAAAGALVTGLLLIEFMGTQRAVLTANGVNLAVASCALVLSRPGALPASRAAPPTDESLPTELPFWVTGLVLFGSGFATLGYEIVWFRALRYLVGNGTYVLTNVLVIFLLGLGIGSLFYHTALRFGRAERNLCSCQLGISLLALLAIGAEQWVLTSADLHPVLSIFSPSVRASSWYWRLAIGSGVAMMIMLPATLWMGLSFPLASRLFLGSLRALPSRVGLAYLLANLGSILGAVVAALWILPRYGTVEGTKLLAVLNLLLGLVIFVRIPSGRTLQTVAVVSLLAVVALHVSLPSRLNFEGERQPFGPQEPQRIFEEEADLGTVQVFASPLHVREIGMAVDGFMIASSRNYIPDFYAKQVLLAYLPMLLDRSIRHTLNVGVASGSTIDVLSRYPWVETLDAVEINPAVVRGASLFLESVVFRDPRANILVEDGVHYLLRTTKTYDLIINDAKQNADFAGNAKILSAEFYEHARARLGACGLFAQWIPLSTDPGAFKMIIRTLLAVFPEVEVFADPPTSTIFIGSRCPVSGRTRATGAELEGIGVAQEIRALFLPEPEALGALWVASGADLAAQVGPGPLNSWDRMLLEFLTYRTRTSPLAMAENLSLLQTAQQAGSSEPPDFAETPLLDSVSELNRAYLEMMEGNRLEAKRLVRGVLEESPEHALAHRAARTMR